MGHDTKRYPDLLTKCDNIGDPKKDPEALLNSDVKTYLTSNYISMPALDSALESDENSDLNVVQLNMWFYPF